MIDTKLLSILVCPLCKGELVYKKSDAELICKFDLLAFPIRDDMPVMLTNEAREISSDERDTL
jgi:uncharacterized protein YbaR (Trm112 family)